MSDVKKWSLSAIANSSASPNGWPEGMSPSGVNDSGREMMAAVRRWYDSSEWRDFDDTPTYVSATSFEVPEDRTTRYHIGRRVRLTEPSGDFKYGTILSSTYTTETTVSLDLDESSLSLSLSFVALGPDKDGDSEPRGIFLESGNNLAEYSASGTAARSNLGVAIGSDVQAFSDELSAIAAISPTANTIIVGTGSTWAGKRSSSARSSLGLGSLATEDTADYVPVTRVIKAGAGMSGGGTMTATVSLGVSFATTAQYSAAASSVALSPSNFIIQHSPTVSETNQSERGHLWFPGHHVMQWGKMLIQANSIDVITTISLSYSYSIPYYVIGSIISGVGVADGNFEVSFSGVGDKNTVRIDNYIDQAFFVQWLTFGKAS